MAIVAWHQDKAKLAQAMNDSSRELRTRRQSVRMLVRRYAAWARTDSGPREYVSQLGQAMARRLDNDTIMPLCDSEAHAVDLALRALFMRDDLQYRVVGMYGALNMDMPEISKELELSQGRVRDLLNSGLDFMDAKMPGMV